jgi:excisionase family DNA binding protein
MATHDLRDSVSVDSLALETAPPFRSGSEQSARCEREAIMLTIKQAAKFLGVPATTFYRWLADPSTGLHEALVPGGRFDREALRAWAKGETLTPAA